MRSNLKLKLFIGPVSGAHVSTEGELDLQENEEDEEDEGGELGEEEEDDEVEDVDNDEGEEEVEEEVFAILLSGSL